MSKKKVLGIIYRVSNLEKACAFYIDLLGFTKKNPASFSDTVTQLELGDSTIYLIQDPLRKTPSQLPSNDLRFQHIALVVRQMENAYECLIQHHIQSISPAPQTIPLSNKSAAGIQAFYFYSPSHHPAELIFFPPNKGRAEWQQKTDSLFLGIDHTALVISDTQTSLGFYQDFLGMRVVGESLNEGETQEKLSGVKQAKVKITNLRFPNSEGPGIELLEYITPRTTQTIPSFNPHADIITFIQVNNIKLTLSYPLVKSEWGSMVTDPDGHVFLLHF